MQILFLDTETTGLNPNLGQIIELGAILTTLDPIHLTLKIEKKFEELIALRSEMDERITRITGITKEELLPAQPIHKVQESWFEYLQNASNNIVIVGHSLQFDLDFLKSEGWYLPESYLFCDTLDLSKILLPHCNAVNLEFLVEKLSLEPKYNQLIQMGITSNALLKPHRALYDTICCLNLTQNLLGVLKNSNFTQDVYKIILENFLPLDIPFFSTEITKISFPHQTNTIQQTKIPIHFNGEVIKASLYDKINLIPNELFLQKLDTLLSNKLPKDLLQIVLQIYVISLLKIDNPESSLKIHTRGVVDFLFAEQVYKVLSDEDQINDYTQYIGSICQFEGIINQIKYISEHNFKLTEFINLLELYCRILKLTYPDLPIFESIDELIACYDFLLLNLQQFWQKSEYYYIPNQLKPEELVNQRKITELYHYLTRFNPTLLPDPSPLLAKIKQSIIHEYNTFFNESNELQIAPSKRLLFRNQGNQISISSFVYQFNLNDAFEKTILQFRGLELQTYLKNEDFDALLKLTGLKQVIDKYKNKVSIEYLGNPDTSIVFSESTNNIKLVDFLEERNEIVQLENKYSLLLCGQNSSLKEIERTLTQEYDPDKYLVLGESGSLTKIVSKMIKNQHGLVVVKNGDFYYISRYLKQFEIAEIWIINQPYFPLHKYWQSLALNSNNKDEYINTLKWLYLKSQASYIGSKTGLNTYFLKSYRV